jgi:hypothetical protein
MMTPTRSRILPRHVQPRIAKRLLRRHEAKVRVAVVAPRLLRIHVLRRIPLAHLRPDLARKRRGIEQRHAPDAARPASRLAQNVDHIMPDRGDSPEAGDDNPAEEDGVIHRGNAAKPSVENKKAFCQKFP